MEKLSTASVENLSNTARFVDTVENLSPRIVDKSLWLQIDVESVEKLSTAFVEKSGNAVCSVDTVENLSTLCVDK